MEVFMAKGRKPLLGQISFRLPVETHKQLLDIAAVLGTDVSGLLNQLLAEGLPGFWQKATEIAQRQKQAREEFQAVTYAIPVPPGSEYLVKMAMDAGRNIKEREQRFMAMLQAIWPHVSKVTAVSVVTLAMEGLDREEDQKRIEAAVDAMYADATVEESEELP
jgi:hypothetical protein